VSCHGLLESQPVHGEVAIEVSRGVLDQRNPEQNAPADSR